MAQDYGYQGSITTTGPDPTSDLLVVDSAGTVPLVTEQDSSTQGAQFANYNSYQQFFDAFQIPGDTANSWSTFYSNFVQAYNSTHGINPINTPFTPTLDSTEFDSFTEAVVQRYQQSFAGGSSPLQTTVSAPLVDGKHPTAILNNIFTLLTQMIESLQNVTAAQANRLTIQADWQSAYTNLQSQVHYAFSTGGSPTIADLNNRTDFNTSNSNQIQIIQARNSLVSDDSKNLQTNVSQSNDAVNQQVSMATSVIQELATILQAIYA